MPNSHPFLSRPHQTLINLSIPVLLSLTAEPLTALVDTAFISSLGVVPLAALGVGTTALSSIFWMFNFLGVGTQTEVAQAFGKGQSDRVRKNLSAALALSAGFGLALTLLLFPASGALASLLGAAGEVQAQAQTYMQIRLFGAPAVLLTLASFGALRGRQDMQSPLWIALGINLLNILLDWLLIFGRGPIPALQVSGSALASTISQWLGAIASILIAAKKLGLDWKLSPGYARRLMQVGWDMFIRTGLLNLFIAYTTRAANQISPNAGAAHQVIRQMWVFAALAMDAFAAAVQSLVGFFMGLEAPRQAKKVVRIGLQWSLASGVVLGLLMWLLRDWISGLMVPPGAEGLFAGAWMISALSQPVNAVAFLTDGAHWGTGDFRYLRNAMVISSGLAIAGLWLLERSPAPTLIGIWILITFWGLLRAIFGWIRVWPGVGSSPFSSPDGATQG